MDNVTSQCLVFLTSARKNILRCMNCQRATDGKKITNILLDELEKLITSKDYFLNQNRAKLYPPTVHLAEIKRKLERLINKRKMVNRSSFSRG